MASASNTRRWLAGVCLLVSLAMLVLGLTVLAGLLGRGFAFLVYWCLCLCLTLLAALIALLDLILLRHQLRQAQKLLIEQTLREAEEEKREKPNS